MNLIRQSLVKIKENFVLEGPDSALNRKRQNKISRQATVKRNSSKWHALIHQMDITIAGWNIE